MLMVVDINMGYSYWILIVDVNMDIGYLALILVFDDIIDIGNQY